MQKKKSNTPGKQHLLPSSLGIISMLIYITTTHSLYHQRCKGTYKNVFNFIKVMYEGWNVEAINHLLEILNGKITDYSTIFLFWISSHLTPPLPTPYSSNHQYVPLGLGG